MNMLQLDPKTTSLICIDLQNGIMAYPTEPYSTDAVLEQSLELIKKFREKNALITFVRVDIAKFEHRLADAPGRDPKSPPPPPEASQLLDVLKLEPNDLVITKPFWGAFEKTELEKKLKEKGIKTIVMCGVATNMGVESTARSAAGLGFDVVFAEDAMSSLGNGAHEFAINTIFPRLGRVRSTEEIILQS